MSLTIVLLTILGLLCFYLFGRIYLHFTFWQRQGISAFPFITLDWALKQYPKLCLDEAVKYGKIFGFYDFSSQALILNDARLARDLSIKSFTTFPIRFSFHLGTTNIRKSLFFLDATEDWKRIRSIVTPAFTSGKLKSMMTPMERITANFIEHLRPMARSGETFDLKKYIGGLTMDIIARCGYGIELDSITQPDHPVVVNAKKILNVDASPSFIISALIPWLGRVLQLEPFDKKAVDFFDQLTFRIVEQRKANSGKQNPDLLGLMIEESQSSTELDANQNPANNTKSLKGISNDEMSGQGIIFFVAGFDTTHATFDHALYYLSHNPVWQEKLFQELDPLRESLNYETFQNLPILNAIMNETLRLCPPLVEFHRIAAEDTELLDTGIKIPKGTTIAIRPLAIHRDPEYFPEPLVFKPERFLDGSGLESHFAFMPFGVGPRTCVGMRFAQNELRIGLANFVLNYRVEMEQGLQLEYFRGSILMSPKKLMVKISER